MELTILLVHKGSFSTESAFSLLGLFQLSNKLKINIKHIDISHERPSVDLYQCLSLEATVWFSKASNTDLLLIADSNVSFNQKDLIEIVNTNADIVSAVIDYEGVERSFEAVSLNNFKNYNNRSLRLFNLDFTLFRKSAFQKLIPKFPKIALPEGDEVYPFFQQTEVNGIWLSGLKSFCRSAFVSNVVIQGYVSQTETMRKTFLESRLTGNLLEKPIVWNDKTVVYYCPQDLVYWSPRIFRKSGLGGSETAVVKLAEYWQLCGYKVYVYGNVEEGEFDGVQYLSTNKFSIRDIYNVLVLWRGGITVLNSVNAGKIFVDLHDNPNEAVNQLLKRDLNKVDKIVVRSRTHQDLLDSELYGKVVCIQNGVDKEMLHKSRLAEEERNHYRMIYASSYDRGLFQMLQHGYPLIKRAIPEVELHVYYGMELLPKYQHQIIKTLLDQPGITDHGKVDQAHLAEERWRSSIHYYVGGFEETDCITVKESVCCGCIPILGSGKVFKEREYLSDFIVAEEDGYSEESQIKAAEKIIELYQNTDLFDSLKSKIWETSQTDLIPSWEDIGNVWIKMFS